MHNMMLTIIIILLAIFFAFVNGFHDTATAVATSITTRALSLRDAVIICAIFNFIGAFLGTSVAKTIGDGIVNISLIPQWVIAVVLIGAIAWDLITWYFSLPTSSTYALIGALVGAAIAYNGSLKAVTWSELFSRVILWLFLSPLIGFALGIGLMLILRFLVRKKKPSSLNPKFLKLEILAAVCVALDHGANDSQKCMAMITLALLSGGFLGTFVVPFWVIAISALAMAIGTGIGGKRIIKTMGAGVTKLTPADGFIAQLSGAIVVAAATLFKAPVSTTQTLTTAIMGVGTTKNVKAVRWGMAKDIVVSWILTIPLAAIITGILVLIIKPFI